MNRFIHGDKLFDKDGDVYRILPVQMTYRGWDTQRQRSKDEFVALTQKWHTKGWSARQGEIEKLENELSTTKQVLGNVIDMEVAKVDNLKAQLNNMEACYIKKKKQVEAVSHMLQGDLKYVEQDRRGNFDFLQMAMILLLMADIKVVATMAVAPGRMAVISLVMIIEYVITKLPEFLQETVIS